MCGLAGLVRPARDLGAPALAAAAAAMAQRLRHRGPDADGVWADPAAGVALAHRRLAILELSDAGAQPMASDSGRQVLVFNGEIYNHAELRRALGGPGPGGSGSWRGGSDTEVLLAGCVRWGVEATLARCAGMFALALWDADTGELVLARDRFGEKPLYYGWHRGEFLFGSELKALRVRMDGGGTVDPQALALYLFNGYVPSPHAIVAGIAKLPPGCLLRCRPRDLDSGRSPAPQPWWSARDVLLAGLADPWRGSLDEAADELERLLGEAVAGQMLADVPVGAFLSGGIDSSTVVALMRRHGAAPVRTFTIGFNASGFDEAPLARAVATHLGTRHEEMYVPGEAALALVPRLPELYDEPFGDSSAIPTHLVSQAARRHVTVSLSGDGGDELLGGYDRYFITERLARRLGAVPQPLRAALGRMLAAIPVTGWNALLGRGGRLLPARLRRMVHGDRLARLGALLPTPPGLGLYRQLLAHWAEPALLLQQPPARLDNDWDDGLPPQVGLTRRMMHLDACTYLPDDILVKVDRAAMGVSLETRAPFLDHRVHAFSCRLQAAQIGSGASSKRVLRTVLARHVPPALTERPKMGFGVPLAQWLCGPLRPWAEDLLDPQRLRREGFLQADAVQARWRALLDHGAPVQHLLWDVLMFQAWLARRGG